MALEELGNIYKGFHKVCKELGNIYRVPMALEELGNI